MAEMASMGVGNKAFWDIAPSEEAINDRNINYVLKRRGTGILQGGVGLRQQHGPLLLLASAPCLPQVRLGSDLSLFLIQMFALEPPLLWPHLTMTTLIWVPWAPFLETVPLVLFWALSICTCTEIQLLRAFTGPCIHPTSQRKHH